MRVYSLYIWGGLLSPLFWAQAAQADNQWPVFRKDLLALHEKLTKEVPVRVEASEPQPYQGAAAKGFSYQDFNYYDRATGRLISHVRRAPDSPGLVYEIDVYIYDEAGRVTRDYSALMVPWQMEHPARTFINLHDYPGELRVFRQFDASGEIVYESCEGRMGGEKISLHLESIDVGPKLRATPLYQACFGRLPMKPGPYIKPQ